MRRRTLALSAAVAVCLLLICGDAFGCPVCYGESDDEILRGAELSVLFMVGLTYMLLVGGGVLSFFLYRRHVRRSSAALETG
ncbi:MAG: hypothetical protein K0U98_22900 [Deltaproteobacteria bacterium]|nr:hypothetical protein [Deltaproteobacteria bacterium]